MSRRRGSSMISPSDVGDAPASTAMHYRLVRRVQESLPGKLQPLVYFGGRDSRNRLNIQVHIKDAPLELSLWYPEPTGEVGWVKLERNIIKVVTAMISY